MKKLLLFCFLLSGNLINAQTCINFQDTTLSNTSTTTSYGTPFYSNSGIDFRFKFVSGVNDPPIPGINIGTLSAWNPYNPNFSGNLLWLGDNFVEIDFTSLTYTNKKITFDISYSANPPDINAFNVNGTGLSTLPTGVAYTYTPLSAGIQVKITGPINTIEIRGFEVAIDNLCTEQFLSSGIKEINSLNSMDVYPNPAQNSVIISTKDKIDKLVLLDVLGNVVQVIVKPINNQFDFSESESGVYFIQIYSDDKVISKKIIKQD